MEYEYYTESRQAGSFAGLTMMLSPLVVRPSHAGTRKSASIFVSLGTKTRPTLFAWWVRWYPSGRELLAVKMRLLPQDSGL